MKLITINLEYFNVDRKKNPFRESLRLEYSNVQTYKPRLWSWIQCRYSDAMNKKKYYLKSINLGFLHYQCPINIFRKFFCMEMNNFPHDVRIHCQNKGSNVYMQFFLVWINFRKIFRTKMSFLPNKLLVWCTHELRRIRDLIVAECVKLTAEKRGSQISASFITSIPNCFFFIIFILYFVYCDFTVTYYSSYNRL